MWGETRGERREMGGGKGAQGKASKRERRTRGTKGPRDLETAQGGVLFSMLRIAAPRHFISLVWGGNSLA